MLFLEEKKMKQEIPALLWLAIISLGLMVLGKIGFVFKVGPVILVDALLSGALLVGIIYGHKWAFVLTIIGAVFGIITGFIKGAEIGIVILILDCLVLIPVLMSRSYFFPDSQPQNS